MLAERVLALDGGDEVARDQLRALVDQLVEGVLAVGAGLAPDDRAGRVVDRACRRGRRACRCSPCRPAGSRRRSGAGTGRRAGSRSVWASEEVVVPDAEQRRASPAGSAPSGAVRKCSSISWAPAEQLLEVVHADGERDRQADRRPQRVAAADPVPEPEHVGGVDAELRRPPPRWSRRATKCFATAASSFALVQEPGARGLGVGHRLLRGEGLGGDDEQRARPGSSRFSVSAMCVPSTLETKCTRRSRLAVGLQRLGHHHRARGRSRRCRC